MFKLQVSIIGCWVLQLSLSYHNLVAGFAVSNLVPSSSPTSQEVSPKFNYPPSDASHVGNPASSASPHAEKKDHYDAPFNSKRLRRASEKELVRRQGGHTHSVHSDNSKAHRRTLIETNAAVAAYSGLNTGAATYYSTGMGACGIVSTDTSMIAAASHLLFDTFPGATDNSNLNPICGRKVKAMYGGKSVQVAIVDRCTGCAMFDLDFSPSAFSQIRTLDQGRLHGMTWQWI